MTASSTTCRPRDRDVAMVFQNYALYPHMTVAENIGFALRMRKVPKDEARRRVEETAKILGLAEHLRPETTPALRRPAAARRDGTRDRARAARLPDGRAALEPRREAARADARRDLAHPAAAPGHHRVRHARPGRGDDDGRPRRRPAPRASAAVRRSAASLRAPGEPLRRELHRQPGDEHARRLARAQRGWHRLPDRLGVVHAAGARS